MRQNRNINEEYARKIFEKEFLRIIHAEYRNGRLDEISFGGLKNSSKTVFGALGKVLKAYGELVQNSLKSGEVEENDPFYRQADNEISRMIGEKPRYGDKDPLEAQFDALEASLEKENDPKDIIGSMENATSLLQAIQNVSDRIQRQSNNKQIDTSAAKIINATDSVEAELERLLDVVPDKLKSAETTDPKKKDRTPGANMDPKHKQALSRMIAGKNNIKNWTTIKNYTRDRQLAKAMDYIEKAIKGDGDPSAAVAEIIKNIDSLRLIKEQRGAFNKMKAFKRILHEELVKIISEKQRGEAASLFPDTEDTEGHLAKIQALIAKKEEATAARLAKQLANSKAAQDNPEIQKQLAALKAQAEEERKAKENPAAAAGPKIDTDMTKRLLSKIMNKKFKVGEQEKSYEELWTRIIDRTENKNIQQALKLIRSFISGENDALLNSLVKEVNRQFKLLIMEKRGRRVNKGKNPESKEDRREKIRAAAAKKAAATAARKAAKAARAAPAKKAAPAPTPSAAPAPTPSAAPAPTPSAAPAPTPSAAPEESNVYFDGKPAEMKKPLSNNATKLALSKMLVSDQGVSKVWDILSARAENERLGKIMNVIKKYAISKSLAENLRKRFNTNIDQRYLLSLIQEKITKEVYNHYKGTNALTGEEEEEENYGEDDERTKRYIARHADFSNPLMQLPSLGDDLKSPIISRGMEKFDGGVYGTDNLMNTNNLRVTPRFAPPIGKEKGGPISNAKSKEALKKIVSRDPRNERIWDIVQDNSENVHLQKIMRYLKKYMMSESFIRRLKEELNIVD